MALTTGGAGPQIADAPVLIKGRRIHTGQSPLDEGALVAWSAAHMKPQASS